MSSPDVTDGQSTSRVARRRSRKVQDILAATAYVLAERGYHRTSLDEIAERLDLTKASLYHYFGSKDELVSACLEWASALVTERLVEASRDRSGTATDRLTALIYVQLDSIVRLHPQIAQLFLQPLDWPEPYRERTKQLRRDHDDAFRAVIREGLATGEFVVDNEMIAVHCLHGAMNYVPVWSRSRDEKDYEAIYQGVAASLLRLFVAQPPAVEGDSGVRTGSLAGGLDTRA